MKLNNCLFIAIATAVALTSSFTEAKRDRRDVLAAEADFDNAAEVGAIADPKELWKHKQHKKQCKHNKQGYHPHGHKGYGKHKKCKTQTVVVFAKCTSGGGGGNKGGKRQRT